MIDRLWRHYVALPDEFRLVGPFVLGIALLITGMVIQQAWF